MKFKSFIKFLLYKLIKLRLLPNSLFINTSLELHNLIPEFIHNIIHNMFGPKVHKLRR